MDRLELQIQAEYYRNEYRLCRCSREIAKEMIIPYLDFVNSKLPLPGFHPEEQN